ncbi:MAG: TIGR03790 family protein, partial [Bryobacteraceae bacterium]|nr:TIGR03790 family protein [Bryobacteraceae bacterium]
MTANRKVELSAQMARSVFLFLVTSPILFCADTLLLIVNENSPLSREISQYYASRRNVPAANVCKIRTSESETTDRDSYLKQIEQPVAECLRSRGLVEKILYLLTTAGVPLRVRGTSGPGGSNASVDSELTLLYSKIHRRTFPIDGIVPNPFFGKKQAVFRHPDFPIY